MTTRQPRPGVCRADLHMHSVFSDGLKTPDELCQRAQKEGIQTVALTDHDTTAGLDDMAASAQSHGLEWIPGVEIGCGDEGRVHLLCYGPGAQTQEMTAFLDGMSSDRQSRLQEMVRLLEKQEVHLTPEALASLNRPNVGRAHLARALVACGVVSTTQQAFDRYLADGRCAFVPRKLLTVTQTVALARGYHAVPVLAHPMRLKLEEPALTALIGSLKEAGLMGMEVFHPSATPRQARQLERLARREGLLVTGGSDYHGDAESQARMGHLPTGWDAVNRDLQALRNAILTRF